MPRKKKRKGNYRRGRELLSDKHFAAIQLLASTRYIKRKDICKRLGISRMTLWRWEQRQDFQRELRRRNAEVSRRIDREFRRRWRRYIDRIDCDDVRTIEHAMKKCGLIP